MRHLMKQEDSQLIFKLRCRVTEIKMNMQGMYDTFECEAYKTESESRRHILHCNILLQNDEQYKEKYTPEYERLFDGSVDEQLQISKMFSSNMKILEKYKQT